MMVEATSRRGPWLLSHPTILAALAAYAVAGLTWGWHISEVVSIEIERGLHRDQRVLEGERRIHDLEMQIPILTAMSVRVTALEKLNDVQDRKIDNIDTTGSRVTVENRQTDVLLRLQRLEMEMRALQDGRAGQVPR